MYSKIVVEFFPWLKKNVRFFELEEYDAPTYPSVG